MQGISQQTSVVTGAAQGNGRAIAIGLAAAGARVACCDINTEALAETVDFITRAGGTAIAVRLDISDEAACANAARQVKAELGDAAILVNNAGIIRRTPPDAESFPDDWSAIMSVNATGTIQMIRAFLPQLERTGGRIVNLAAGAKVKENDGGRTQPQNATEGFRPQSHQASSGLTMTQIEIGEHSTKARGLATTPGDNNGCDTKHSKPHHTKGDDGAKEGQRGQGAQAPRHALPPTPPHA